MNKICVAAIIVLSLCMSSCSMPVTFFVLNNSQSSITVISDGDSVTIRPQRAKEITGLDYDFKITTNNQELIYNVHDIELNHVHWAGWGPFKKRMFYAQFESSYEIYVLATETKKPVNEFITQPTGFPIAPST
jgi:guanylate kinase